MEHECICQLIEVDRKKNLVLYEDNSGMENDGCSIPMLKDFFPEYPFDYNKMYFIEIENELYHGDTLETYVYENTETED